LVDLSAPTRCCVDVSLCQFLPKLIQLEEILLPKELEPSSWIPLLPHSIRLLSARANLTSSDLHNISQQLPSLSTLEFWSQLSEEQAASLPETLQEFIFCGGHTIGEPSAIRILGQRCHRLKKLVLTGTNLALQGNLIDHLPVTLEELNMGACQNIHLDVFKSLGKLPNLSVLQLFSTRIGDVELAFLPATLKVLGLSGK
jgi:hypothetical protein